MADLYEIVLVILGFVAFFVLLATVGEIVSRLIAWVWPLWVAGAAGCCAVVVGLIVDRETISTLGASALVVSLGLRLFALMVQRKKR